jgi:hypothetical protein
MVIALRYNQLELYHVCPCTAAGKNGAIRNETIKIFSSLQKVKVFMGELILVPACFIVLFKQKKAA